MFQEVCPAATDGQKSTSSHSVRHVSEIGVSLEREQLKSVLSSSITPEETFKSNSNMEQIKSYIKTYVNEQIAELKILISNIPAEVIKALKKEENKESPDDVNAIITKSVQDALDALIFGLSTPSNTNKFDVVTPNLVTESQWSLSDSQFPPDFPDVQVYVLVNCGKEYHWVLAVIVLNERTIRVYDSLSSKNKSEPPTEIRKLAAMLPTYLSDSGVFEKTERIDWSTLKAYERKLSQQTGEISHNPFDIEYVQNSPQ
ncbi:hypothetical protein BC332_11208 [Capsicum chinense]|nr:hypothetical protein BC332_11208 [Capsicum chinense]